ncbi:putative lysine-specific histone demethylase 1 [Clarias magur]|uniref:Putative lysine-specific histone demethylase 1 n=1 Tax=Clarias magur TaxID=1594786 RepID=A0A8J4UGJ3_CLAMG|nr:putative lysine-specific histone demethylase 1 [Clarias magur]
MEDKCMHRRKSAIWMRSVSHVVSILRAWSDSDHRMLSPNPGFYTEHADFTNADGPADQDQRRTSLQSTHLLSL